VKRLARLSALSQKMNNKEIVVLEDFSFEAPKTKEFKNILHNLELTNKKSTFVLAELNKNIYLSSRNLEKSKVLTFSELNTYRILNSNKLVFSESSLAGLESNFTK
jgi:large subunit ribosomal protein L4